MDFLKSKNVEGLEISDITTKTESQEMQGFEMITNQEQLSNDALKTITTKKISTKKPSYKPTLKNKPINKPINKQPSLTPTIIDILSLNIEKTRSALQSGALTSVQIVDFYYKRIYAYDKAGPKLNSIIELLPYSMAMAQATEVCTIRTLKIIL